MSAVLDLVTKAPGPPLYGRVMNASYGGVMPQVVALWYDQAGHEVSYVCYTGVEDLFHDPGHRPHALRVLRTTDLQPIPRGSNLAATMDECPPRGAEPHLARRVSAPGVRVLNVFDWFEPLDAQRHIDSSNFGQFLTPSQAERG